MKAGCVFLLFVCMQGFSFLGYGQKLVNSIPSEKYQWKNVQIVGGGFVDGIVFHPKIKNVRYCRTDMGGAYRWDEVEQRWQPLLDWLSYDESNLMGVESIALDPNDSETVYLACGTTTRGPNGAILYSRDSGKTFRRVDMPFGMGGNENGRGNGERMMVDPLNSNVIYLGTRDAGLWRSFDRGENWEKVNSFPDVTEVLPDNIVSPQDRFLRMGAGIIFVLFDSSKEICGKGSSSIYVGVSLMGRENLFVSYNGGDTWQPVAGHPTEYRPTQGVLATDGNLYITYGDNPGPLPMKNGAIWKYNTHTQKWQNISPVKPQPEKGKGFGYASVSVDLHNPQHLLVSTFSRPISQNYTEDDLFRSTDGGKTWKSIFSGWVEMDYSNAPYVEFTPLHWMLDVEIDPFNPDHAMFTTGYGGWETYNLSDLDKKKPVKWQVMSKGIEETVPLELYSPLKGAHLISVIGDYGGFTHIDLDRPEPAGSHRPYHANTNGIAGSDLNPNMMVRVGTVSAHHPEGSPLAWSSDGGVTWNMPASIPVDGARNGHIAVSADGNRWIWTPDRSPVFYTSDKGTVWHKSEGIPDNIRVVGDRVNPLRFYGLDMSNGILYESGDGGVSFVAKELPILQQKKNSSRIRGDRRGGQDRVYATPSQEGELWIAAYDGLYHLVPGGDWEQKDKVRNMYAFGFGKPASDSDSPALYMAGVVNGIYGFFRSDDNAKSWVRINDDEYQYGAIFHITGDPKVYGRVYVGTHGRGVLYGDLLEK